VSVTQRAVCHWRLFGFQRTNPCRCQAHQTCKARNIQPEYIPGVAGREGNIQGVTRAYVVGVHGAVTRHLPYAHQRVNRSATRATAPGLRPRAAVTNAWGRVASLGTERWAHH